MILKTFWTPTSFFIDYLTVHEKCACTCHVGHIIDKRLITTADYGVEHSPAFYQKKIEGIAIEIEMKLVFLWVEHIYYIYEQNLKVLKWS